VKLSVHTCWEKNVVLNIVFVKIILQLLLCSLPSVAFPFILKLSLMFFDMGFEVFIVIRTRNGKG